MIMARHGYMPTGNWECVCSCQNEPEEPRCWNCNRDIDGELPETETETEE